MKIDVLSVVERVVVVVSSFVACAGPGCVQLPPSNFQVPLVQPSIL